MFTRKTILGEEQKFEKGYIVATVSDIDDKNVRLNFGYDYDAVISKEEFDFDVKKDDLVNILVINLTSLTGPVVVLCKDFVSITLKREHYKKNLAKEALKYATMPPIIVPPNGSPILKSSLPLPGMKKSGWYYYFEIVEPKGIVTGKDVLCLPDILFFDTPLNPEYHKKEMKKIAEKGIEIISEYKSKGYVPHYEWKDSESFPQERILIDNISIFMHLNKAEVSDNNDHRDIREDLSLSHVRPSMRAMMSNSRHRSTMNTAEESSFDDESNEREKIYDISDCDLENIEEFLKRAKSKEDNEMVFIKCRGVIESILKEIIKIDNRIDYDRYNHKTPGEILNDDYIRRMFSENIIHSMINIIKLGNDAAHTNSESLIDCKKVIEDTEEVFSWFKINYKKA